MWVKVFRAVPASGQNQCLHTTQFPAEEGRFLVEVLASSHTFSVVSAFFA